MNETVNLPGGGVALKGPSLKLNPGVIQGWHRAVFPIYVWKDEKRHLYYQKGAALEAAKRVAEKVDLRALHVHFDTGQIYNSDSEAMIWNKARRGLFMNPFVILARTVSCVVRGIFASMKGVCLLNRNQELASAKRCFRRAGKTLVLGVQMERALYRALRNPLDGRAEYGRLERALNEQEEGADFRTAYYSARCFQPIADLKDEKWLEKVQTYLHKSAIFEEVYGAGKLSWLDKQRMVYGCQPLAAVMKKYGLEMAEFQPEAAT